LQSLEKYLERLRERNVREEGAVINPEDDPEDRVQ
jgi:hypothetical protein